MQDYALRAFRFFQQDFYTLVIAWGIKNLNSRSIIALHGEHSKKGKLIKPGFSESPLVWGENEIHFQFPIMPAPGARCQVVS
jgi:hypothetical protein